MSIESLLFWFCCRQFAFSRDQQVYHFGACHASPKHGQEGHRRDVERQARALGFLIHHFEADLPIIVRLISCAAAREEAKKFVQNIFLLIFSVVLSDQSEHFLYS